MEYQEIIDYVGTLDFASEPHVADAMTKAVLGILFNSVDESAAQHLAEHLPDPLTVEDLRGRQVRKNAPSFNGKRPVNPVEPKPTLGTRIAAWE